MKRLRRTERAFLAALIIFLAWQPRLAAGDIQQYPYRFIHESYGNESLQKMRRLHDYDEYVMAAGDEYARMTLLKEWVFGRLRYSFKSPVPDMRNSLSILERAGQGTKFLCTSYAALYMQCALSMGWTARYVFLRRPTGEQHAAVDIWSNRYRKWIYVDPTWNIHVEERGVPMSLPEIRRRWLKRDYRGMDFVFSAGSESRTFTSADFPVRRNDSELWQKMPLDEGWISYTYEIAVVGRNNFFTHRDGTGRDIWDSIYIIKDSHNRNDRHWPFRYGQSLPEETLFSPLNTPAYSISEKDNPSPRIRVALDHRGRQGFTPNFDHYEIYTNGRWKRTGKEFETARETLRQGIPVRVVNRCGIAGPVLEVK